MDLLAMRPSECRKLAAAEIDGPLVDEILTSLETLLSAEARSPSPSGEEVYLAAVELSEGRLWDRLPKDRIAALVSRSSVTMAKALLDGMPSSCRDQVRSLLEAPALTA